MHSTDIKSLTHAQLLAFAEDIKLPKFRVKQIEQWIYEKHVDSFEQMTNLSKPLRLQLAECFTLNNAEISYTQISSDGTRKYLVRFADGITAETVGIPSADNSRLTVCISSQAGCPMGCVFCATGRNGFARNLTVGEIFDQVYLVAKDFNRRVSNVVVMGQGEPFLNYDSVLQALRYLNSENGLGIGARHITVSTCGVIKGIERFSQENEQFTLAISLHSAIQSTRDQIMPGISSSPLDDLRESLKVYGDTTKRRPTLEYAPILGINDDDDHISALVDFCHGMLAHVNLIPLNPVTDSSDPEYMEPSPRIDEFYKSLSSKGIDVSIRSSRGADIDGACGQLKQNIK